MLGIFPMSSQRISQRWSECSMRVSIVQGGILRWKYSYNSLSCELSYEENIVTNYSKYCFIWGESFVNKFYNVCRYMITIAVWVTMNLQITHSYSVIYSSGGWWRIVSSITNISHLWIWTEYSVRMYYLSVRPPLLISLFSVWPITSIIFHWTFVSNSRVLWIISYLLGPTIRYCNDS